MKNLDAIYFAVRKLAPEDRPAYLTKACAGDDELQKRVEQMLAVSAEAEAFITDLPDDESEDRTSDNGSAKNLKLDLADAPDEAVGQMIGRYKILERVGEGGCGVVYVAEQTEPVRRRVALKVIKLGMDTKQVVARFEAERQALAMMDHPNIAKVLDAGTTGVSDQLSVASGQSSVISDQSRGDGGRGARRESLTTDHCPLITGYGRPYFVMELVRGIRITDYCDQANLSTKERLDLFIKVCQAIQHAHQKGIIHRDIKPSNILVTLHDGVPVPKVIDFGIAKATEGRLTDNTVYTQLHQFIGTPAYMSPEQAEMSGLDIDTRSDIYSLGVLLYELLAGSTPFDSKELMESGIDAMRKTIREKEPVRPSTKLSQTLAAADVRRLKSLASDTTSSEEEVRASSSASDKTAVDRRRLLRAKETITLLKGDLDWIVMKCLEKDRTRRYETANGLAADLNRHLTNEPVLARRPTTAYRLQKAFRRNQLAFIATATVAAALLIGIVMSTWQAVRATRAERDQVKLREAAVTAATLAKQETKRADEQAEANRLNLYAADMLAAQVALQNLNYGKARQLLDRHRPSEGEKDLRGFEWRMLWRQSRGDQLNTLRAHSWAVLCVSFTPDGKYVLSGSADNTVVVWDADTGRKVNSWKANDGGVNSISFSSDGKILATGGQDGIKLWQWPGAGLMETITNSGAYAQFHPSKMLLFTGFGQWYAGGGNTNGGALFKFGASNRPERETAFRTPRGSFSVPARVNELVAVGGGDQPGQPVLLMDQHGALIRTLNDSQSAGSLAFAPKADLLAVTSSVLDRNRPQNEIRIHDPATGKLLITLTNHTGRVFSADFSPDGKWLASASSDQTIRLWDTTTWQQVKVLQGHGSEVWAAAFSPDSKHLASASLDETVCLWNVEPEHRVQEIKGADIAYGYGGDFATFMRSEGLLAAVARSGNTNNAWSIWNVTTGRLEHEFAPTVQGLGEDAAAKSIITLSRDGEARLQFWDPHDFRLKQEVRIEADVVGLPDTSLSFDRKSVLLVGPGKAVQVDCANGCTLRQILLPTAPLNAVRWKVRLSPRESSWAAFGPFSLIVGQTGSTREAVAIEGHRQRILSIGFSPTESLLATASIDGNARLWEVPSGRLAAVLAGHKEGVFDCAFSPDGRTLATASRDRTVKLWHIQTHREMLTLTHKLPVTSVFFSREGNYLATGTVDGTYHFWRAASWEEIKTAGAPVRSDSEGATLRED